jgi:ABC-type multidrug transport system ATPase subunit
MQTTLLKLLGGQTQSGEFSGVRMINGEALAPGRYDARMRRQGFVAQRDTLLEALTVWETLVFAAMLRISDDVPTAGKLNR